MNKKLVTVIIPAYNCEDTITVAINSILKQTYPHLEVIVVDDKSTDGTARVVEEIAAREPRVRLIRETRDDVERFDAKLNRNINAGYSARNLAFPHVRGEYVTFQDADDSCFLNRIETQVELLEKHSAIHITTDWIKLEEQYLGKTFDVAQWHADGRMKMIGPNELYRLSQSTKGIALKILGRHHSKIPFHWKRARLINKLFFGAVTSYPGVTGIPLFRRELIEKLRFRKLAEREWPSFMGRGTDRDFSFQVAEQFKKSYVFLIPLYLWRTKTNNIHYSKEVETYIK